MKAKQLKLFKDSPSKYGGDLLKTRAGRATPRPLAVESTMHMSIRSSLAIGPWSFKQPGNAKKIEAIIQKFAGKNGVTILSWANVGNHLHFHLKLFKRGSWRPFIRALTAAIAMAVTGVNRWNRLKGREKLRFWDRRPFTRVLKSFREKLTLKDYIEINQLEGFGNSKQDSRDILAERKEQQRGPPPWLKVALN